MALPIGLTSAGLQIPTVDDVIVEIRDNLWAAFSTSLEFSSALPLYPFTSVFANRFASLSTRDMSFSNACASRARRTAMYWR